MPELWWRQLSSELPSELPPGHWAVPIPSGSQLGASICLVVATSAAVGSSSGPVGTPFGPLLLRLELDSRVYLGCIVDERQKVWEWLEVAVQDLDRVRQTLPEFLRSADNPEWDARWRSRAEALAANRRAGLWWTGWETHPPRPLFLTVRDERPVLSTPRCGDAEWRLCTDDRLLESRGFKTYSNSLHRYLWLQNDAGESLFWPARLDPNSDLAGARAAVQGFDVAPGSVEFNSCGLMMVRPHWPIPLDAHADEIANVDDVSRDCPNRFVFGRHQMTSRLLEAFYLKLCLLIDAVSEVRTHVEATSCPFFGLTAASFRVRTWAGGARLPRFWGSRVALVGSGVGVRLMVKGTEEPYFWMMESSGPSAYRPDWSVRSGSSVGQLTVVKCARPPREVGTDDEQELPAMDCALTCGGRRFETRRGDLVWMEAVVGGDAALLPAIIHGQDASAGSRGRGGRLEVRTVPTRLSAHVRRSLEPGVVFPDVRFTVTPKLSSPCDLYALSTLGLRLLMCRGDQELPEAADDLMSLADAARSVHHSEGIPHWQRVEHALSQSTDLAGGLGPQRLAAGSLTAPVTAAVPSQLWCQLLSILIRMRPGADPESFCNHEGDAPRGAIHTVFDGCLNELREIAAAARGMMFAEHEVNSSVRRAIRAAREAL